MSEANEAGAEAAAEAEAAAGTAAGAETPQPTLKVVTPDTTPEEIAALVAVFSALGGGEAPAQRRESEWSAKHRRVRVNYSHGPGGWRSSALPR